MACVDLKLGESQIVVYGNPLVSDGYFEIERIIFNGVDIWPVLSELDMGEKIADMAEKALPGFIRAAQSSQYKEMDEALFKYGK